MRTLIIGDIHGCFDELSELISIFNPQYGDKIITVGDVIGKGPKPNECIELLIKLNAQVVMGNHEFFFNERISQNKPLPETYEIDSKYHSWIANLPVKIETDNYIILHAGFYPPLGFEKTSVASMIAIRNVIAPDKKIVPWFDLYKGKKKIYFGHWAELGLEKGSNYMALDTGCVYGKQLTGYIIEEDKFIQVNAKKVYSKINLGWRPPMPHSIIDIGSNSIKLLTMRKDRIFNDFIKYTRLSEGLSETDTISKKALKRTIDAINELLLHAYATCSDKIVLLGTYAFRKAKNRDEVLNQIEKETGYPVKVLTEKEEAEYSFYGALKYAEKSTVVSIDIGGGSTEITVGNNDKSLFSKSFPFGCVNMSDKYIKSDPPLQSEIDNLSNYIYTELENNNVPILENITMVGSGGTVTALAFLAKKIKKYIPMHIDKMIISNKEITEVAEKLHSMKIKEKEKLSVLSDKRADIIDAGAIILKSIINYFKINEITIAIYGIRFGAFYKMLEN